MSGITEELQGRDDVAAALIKSLEAEARSNDAEAAWHDTERKFREVEVAAVQIDLDRAIDVRERELVGDYYRRIYPFLTSVGAETAKSCIKQLNTWFYLDPAAPIEIIFNSPGGSVVDGLALYDHIVYLRAQGARINTVALGMAASMAGILLQAGDKRIMGAESWLMIHEVSFGASGKIGEVEDTTDWVKAVQKRVLAIFAKRSNQTEAQLARKWKRTDWWIDSDEALKLGLIDEIR